MRKLVIVAALLLGTAGYADTSADKKKDPPTKESGGKAKAGGACKADADCDQGRPQRCRDSKCELLPTHPVT